MKKFGFGKKSERDDDDRKSAGLFGRKKPTAQEENPYAQQPPEDPYARMTPYQQARANLAAGPQAPRPGAAGLPNGPRPGAGGLPSGPGPAQRNGYSTPPPSYQGNPQVGGGYAPDKFGAAGGYGSNRYDSGASAYGSARATSALPSQRVPTRGPGGYGGLGPADEEANRDELLAGARQRQAAPPPYVSTDNNDSSSGAAGDAYGGGYGEQRELTEEELEKQEYGDIKNKISDTLTETNQSLDRTLAIIDQATDTGTSTLARFAGQRERLHNTQKNLDLAANQHRIATDKTKELQTLSRSMFAVHVSNPFNSKQRLAEKDQQVLERHRMERENREAIRKQQFHATQNMEKTFNELSRPAGANGLANGDMAAARSKYQFDENSEDEEWVKQEAEKEVLINGKIDLVGEGVKKLHTLAVRQGQEVAEQNDLIDVLQKDVSHFLVCVYFSGIYTNSSSERLPG
jgi:hypothetical protein